MARATYWREIGGTSFIIMLTEIIGDNPVSGQMYSGNRKHLIVSYVIVSESLFRGKNEYFATLGTNKSKKINEEHALEREL